MGSTTTANNNSSADPLRAFLEQHASASRCLYSSDEVEATHFTLRDCGTQVVLKITSKDRADYESEQVANEVKAARCLPDCSCLGHQVAWKQAQDGTFLSVSLYAGPTVESLLEPGGGGAHGRGAGAGAGDATGGGGGWAGLALSKRVEVVRDVLAGGVHALIKMRPWLHFDIKPANVAVMQCPAGGPPHITLLDMGATTHIAALHTPSRSTLYPVVSTDHMDVALITKQPGQEQMPYETKQGCRDALSHNTDIFTLGLLAYKVLLGPQLPPELDWNSAAYDPWDAAQEAEYVLVQQRLARDLAAGSSSHAPTRELFDQLPADCRQALGRMCDPDPVARAQLQEVAGLPFIQQRLTQIGAHAAARDAAYSAQRQQLINLLQGVPGIELSARPVKPGRLSASGSLTDLGAAAAAAQQAGGRAAAAVSSTDSGALPPPQQQQASNNGPPGFPHRLKHNKSGTAAPAQQQQQAPGGFSFPYSKHSSSRQQEADRDKQLQDQQRQQRQQDNNDGDASATPPPPGFHYKLQQHKHQHQQTSRTTS